MVERFTAAGAWRQAAGRRHASVHLLDDADVIEVARRSESCTVWTCLVGAQPMNAFPLMTSNEYTYLNQPRKEKEHMLLFFSLSRTQSIKPYDVSQQIQPPIDPCTEKTNSANGSTR